MTALDAAASTRRRSHEGLALRQVVGRLTVVAVGGEDGDDAVPSLTARAIAPAVWDASSSGWAWTKTTVDIPSASHRAPTFPPSADAAPTGRV